MPPGPCRWRDLASGAPGQGPPRPPQISPQQGPSMRQGTIRDMSLPWAPEGWCHLRAQSHLCVHAGPSAKPGRRGGPGDPG